MIDLTKSNVYRGIPAAQGIKIGKAFLFKKEIEKVVDEKIANVEEAIESFVEALEKSKKELAKVFSLAVDKLGAKRAKLFEAQIMILSDQILIDRIIQRIREEKKLAEFIVHDEISKYQKLMASSDEQYMKERSHDIEDIKNRIIRNIRKKKWKSRITDEEVILVSDVLTPADTVLFSRLKVIGYVTKFGGLTSHAAIVARSLNVPAVVGVHDATEIINDNDTLIIDGFNGIVVVNPTSEQTEYYQNKLTKLAEENEKLAKLRDLPAETLDGKKISIYANLDMNEELELILQNGSEGVGLMRTEQIFQEYDSFPSEEEQAEVYSNFAEKLYPLPLTVRAFDIGGDKVLPVDVKEPNPMLGWRGIRFLLDNKKLFKSQIRAVLKASIHKNIKFMIPMVSSIKELLKTKELIAECKGELNKEGIAFDDTMELGIMIEIPSAALMVKDFAEEVDFFSIGTNDLIQYLLAVDRGNEIVTDHYQEFHPAVIRTIRHIITEAKKSKTKVTLCGEMAANYKALPLLIGLGLDSISVSGPIIPHAKEIIRSLNYSEISSFVIECLSCKTELEIHQKLEDFYSDKFKESSNEFFN